MIIPKLHILLAVLNILEFCDYKLAKDNLAKVSDLDFIFCTWGNTNLYRYWVKCSCLAKTDIRLILNNYKLG